MTMRTYDKLIATIFHRQSAVHCRRARFGAPALVLPGPFLPLSG